MEERGYLFLQEPNKLWQPNGKLKDKTNGNRLRAEMFAPPQHVKSVSKVPGNRPSSTEGKSKQTTKWDGKDRKSSMNEAEDLSSGWSSFPHCLETAVEGDVGLKDWCTRAVEGHKPAAKVLCRERWWPTSSRCPAFLESERSCSLSEYLKNLKSLLSRNKALSAGTYSASMRYNHNSSTFPFGRQGLASSAPCTASLRRRTQASSYNKGNHQNAQNVSIIPCRNYCRPHKHSSFQELQNCNRQARLDNQYRSFSLDDIKTSRYRAPPSNQQAAESTICAWLNGKEELKQKQITEKRVAQSDKEDCDIMASEEVGENSREVEEVTENADGARGERCNNVSDNEIIRVSQHSTMQEYIEKYYTAPVKASVTKGSLPAIAEKEHRLVENIINYRHTSSREREAIHKNRFMQLTATDIRRTTALLLKTSTNRSSANQQRTVGYLEPESVDSSKEAPTASVGVTLAQLMGPKATAYRTKTKVPLGSANSKTVISNESLSYVGSRWQIPRYQ